MLKYLLFFSLIIFSFPVYSQKNLTFWSLSGPEKWWVITHPFVAGKAKKITTEARIVSEEIRKDSLLDHDSNGGRIDAFRHAYWMARLSQNFCWKKALSLGKAHEKGNYRQFKNGKKDEEGSLPDSISSAMDLFNNRAGASLGCENASTNKEELKKLIIVQILEGKMVIISKNPQGIPIDCNGNLLEQSTWSGIWDIPKCLIPSGF
jgi:hypothetical protein